MNSVTLEANMVRLPRTGAKPLGAKQGSHIVSFTADYLHLPAPSAPHQAIVTGILHHHIPGGNLKVGALRVAKRRPLTDVPSSPYTQLNINGMVKAPPPHFMVQPEVALDWSYFVLWATQTLLSRWFLSLES